MPVRPRSARAVRCALVLSLALLAIGSSQPAAAGEGGSSHYNPGALGDFAMAVIGPPGFYLRNDLLYMDLEIGGGVSLGRFAAEGVDQEAWVDVVKGIYIAPTGVLGGRFGAAVSLPIVFDAALSGDLVAPPVSRSGSRGGIGDMGFTGFLNWNRGDFHANAGLTVYAPTGFYDEDRIINLGRNYWSFDPAATFTWLDAERGHEVSVVTGVMFNTENQATDYQTGEEFHLGFMLAQHFSPKLALGLTGYYYRQLTDDEGPLVDRLAALGLVESGFRGDGFGLGPAVKYTPTLFGRPVNFILKWLHDIDSSNRFEGDRVYFSVAFGF